MSIEPASSRAAGCLSELALDEWLAGEGTPEQRAAWEAHVSECEACRHRREERAEFNRRYLASSSDLDLALQRFERTVVSSGPARARRRSWLIASGGLALAASVLAFLALPRQTDDGLATRLKGQTRFTFYVKSGGSVRPGSPGESVRPGDALRFVVPRAESRYLVVLGRDSLGVTSVYFPEGPLGVRASEGVEELAEGIALGSSVVLDAAPGTERFYAVFCDEAQPTSELKDELAESGRLAPRAGCEVAETSVTKSLSEGVP